MHSFLQARSLMPAALRINDGKPERADTAHSDPAESNGRDERAVGWIR
jgi:hypothetical protein